MPAKRKTLEITEHLDSPEVIAGYIEAAMEENDPALITEAVGEVARAIGMSSLSEATGLNRVSLYKSFGEGGNPTLTTLTKLFKAMGLRLSVLPERTFLDAKQSQSTSSR